MALSDELQALASDLLEATKDGRAKWKEAHDVLAEALEDDDFVLETERFAVNIFKNHDSDELHLNLLNDSGTVIGSASTAPGDDEHVLLQELRSAARGCVFDVDQAISFLRAKFPRDAS